MNPLKNTKAELKEAIIRHMRNSIGKEAEDISPREAFLAASLAVRDRLADVMLKTESKIKKADAKRVYYLSMEYLIGRTLGNNLINLGLNKIFKDIFTEMGFEFDEIKEIESDSALGNGGLARLAACTLDSIATLGLSGMGYGIYYDFGMFRQIIANGFQKEKPVQWTSTTWPITFDRSESLCIIPIYGKIKHETDRDGKYNPMWMDWRAVLGIPIDIPISGYGGKSAIPLRLFKARSSNDFDISIFKEGDYFKAISQKIETEKISKILYPLSDINAGNEMRLVQQYFLAACSVRDILNRYLSKHTTLDQFADKTAIHINDTSPALAVIELMRAFVDEHNMEWDKAFNLTKSVVGFTSHSLLPQTLEEWPVDLLEYVLPRHLQILYEINHRFLNHVYEIWPDDHQKKARMSMIAEGYPKKVRMANIAVSCAHMINGVSKLHTSIMKKKIFPDFHDMYPRNFICITNGITQRRWLLKANPDLAHLINNAIGDEWITDLSKMKLLEPFSGDMNFRKQFLGIKRKTKEKLAEIIKNTAHTVVSPDALFDIHAKRIQEYKRQLLNIIAVIYEYIRAVEDDVMPEIPKVYIFAGKATPGYHTGGLILKFIHDAARVINSDKRLDDMIKVVFIPDYRVWLAERIITAADLSEQISTAGFEASGTGNMKFALNGALTICTPDGANPEMEEEIGRENMFVFGHTSGEIASLTEVGAYNSQSWYHRYDSIKRTLDAISSGRFSSDDPARHSWVIQSLINSGDPYFMLADFPSYIAEREKAARLFSQKNIWAEKAILNISRMGFFSIDRTVTEYAKKMWNIPLT